MLRIHLTGGLLQGTPKPMAKRRGIDNQYQENWLRHAARLLYVHSSALVSRPWQGQRAPLAPEACFHATSCTTVVENSFG